MTQKDISERTGLAGSYLSRIENRHLEPRPRTLRKIAAALDVPVSELFQDRPARTRILAVCHHHNRELCHGHAPVKPRQAGEGHVESYSPANCSCCGWPII